jgi:hypothetical protein
MNQLLLSCAAATAISIANPRLAIENERDGQLLEASVAISLSVGVWQSVVCAVRGLRIAHPGRSHYWVSCRL